MAHHTPFTALGYLCIGSTLCVASYAQTQELTVNHSPALQSCAAVPSDAQRLACFDALASQSGLQQQRPNVAWYGASAANESTPALNNASVGMASQQGRQASPASPDTGSQQVAGLHVVDKEGCRNSDYGITSRMWELTRETDCGNFRFRGYRPISFAVSVGNRVNKQPYSPGVENGLAEYNDYQHQETRIQLSIRTKLASNILTNEASDKRDSLWFGYTSNSYWQAFNSRLSRPFRNTDYQPELIYVYPLELQLPWNAKLRYAGLGLNHQSNGQSNPLSRSWNRYYAMLGIDVGPDVRLQARLWHRISEKTDKDDNPFISDYIGRGEFSAAWDVNPINTLTMTVHHSLRSSAKGSARIEWYRTLGEQFAGGKSNLRLYTSLFSGYGDSLIDYNFRRTVFSVGVSLMDF